MWTLSAETLNMLSRLQESGKEYGLLIFMDLLTDVPTQLHLSWTNEQRRGKIKLKGMLAGAVSSVFLVISQPLDLQAKLNPKTARMALTLLAQT